jgi:hypothetical protein
MGHGWSHPTKSKNALTGAPKTDTGAPWGREQGAGNQQWKDYIMVIHMGCGAGATETKTQRTDTGPT